MLGPFHDEEAHSFEYGQSIISDGTPREPTIVRGFVRDTDGNVVPKALIDVWETDGNGVYDLDYAGSQEPNFRGKIFTDDRGHFSLSVSSQLLIRSPMMVQLASFFES